MHLYLHPSEPIIYKLMAFEIVYQRGITLSISVRHQSLYSILLYRSYIVFTFVPILPTSYFGDVPSFKDINS
ncbi:hypothetical protein AQUCO_02000590v1 [Aquilegia coerulea]|uniref:Uncharacterized protein n=1 Tax=Aquilegia coerulea TaxID=218851 RepID=A0A2G5DIF8_AQUCA|nr:hypothetical protein AQUCO_02000590v1 [Aquilegia coerulea]